MGLRFPPQRICKVCGTMNDAKHIFCNRCGSVLNLMGDPTKKGQCVICGHENPEGSRFCGMCHSPTLS